MQRERGEARRTVSAQAPNHAIVTSRLCLRKQMILWLLENVHEITKGCVYWNSHAPVK